MTRFEPGEVVLLAFPFADHSGQKRRPAVVVLDSGDQDLVVARVTTQPHATPFDLPVTGWPAAGLLAPSVIRLHKLATVAKGSVTRKIGELPKADQVAFWSLFRRVYCESPAG